MDRSRRTVWVVAAAVAGFLMIHFVGTAGLCAQPEAGAETVKAGPAEAPAGAAVFEMKYRGLDTPDDPLSYRAYWGFGAPGRADSEFARAVMKQLKKCEPLYNGELRGREWSVVEIENGKPVALHFDIDGDGKPSGSERFGPATPLKRFSYPYCFITSDFAIRTQDGREVPFRVMLVGMQYGSQPIAYMWSPCCVLEGQAVLDDEPTRLLLYGSGFTGAFTDFGQCSFALIPAEYKPDGLIGRSTLSSLINHDRHFYRLKLAGSHDKDKTLHVILEKDTTPTGRIAMRLAAKEVGKSRLTNMTLQGASDATVQFYAAEAQSPLPVMQYKLSSAYVCYGVESDDQWRVNFNDGPEFTAEASRTREIDLGSPALSVRAVDERERYSTDAKERTTFANATTVYLAPQIRGKAGELYLRFTQRPGGSGDHADVRPHYAIVDSDGRQVASGDMEYG